MFHIVVMFTVRTKIVISSFAFFLVSHTGSLKGDKCDLTELRKDFSELVVYIWCHIWKSLGKTAVTERELFWLCNSVSKKHIKGKGCNTVVIVLQNGKY